MAKTTIVTGVGSEIKTLISEGKMSNKEILAEVLRRNPARKTTYACVAWYQTEMRKHSESDEAKDEAEKVEAAEAWAKAEAEAWAKAEAEPSRSKPSRSSKKKAEQVE